MTIFGPFGASFKVDDLAVEEASTDELEHSRLARSFFSAALYLLALEE
jgi:hypothetical protein